MPDIPAGFYRSMSPCGDRSPGLQPSDNSAGAIAGRFVRSWVESISPGYLADQQQRLTGRQPSFIISPDLMILTERLIATVCPQYRLLTTVFPEAGISQLSGWLAGAAGRTIAA